MQIPYLNAQWNIRTQRLHEVKTVLMEHRDAKFWDRYIQPVIRKDVTRADRYWRWLPMLTLLPPAQYLKGYRTVGLVSLLRSPTHGAVPAAMMLLIEPYPHPTSLNDARDSVFIWFLAVAPPEALARWLIFEPPSLGHVCVDNAVVYSMNAGHSGAIGLHCAKAGGDRLMGFYQERIGLARLEESAQLPYGRKNDGRFFHHRGRASVEFLRKNSLTGTGSDGFSTPLNTFDRLITLRPKIGSEPPSQYLARLALQVT